MIARILCCTLIMLLPEFLGAQQVESKRVIKSDALVCTVGLRVPYAVPKTEVDISSPTYCRYTIDKDVFLHMIAGRPESELYFSGDARAKVIFSSEVIYFIDAYGIVRMGNKKFILIDKGFFENSLKKINKKTRHVDNSN